MTDDPTSPHVVHRGGGVSESRLASLAGLVDEIVVIASDAVPCEDVVHRCGGVLCVVGDGAEDSRARHEVWNTAWDRARGEWLLCLEADETVAPCSRSELMALLGAEEVEGYLVPVVVDPARPEGARLQLRLFRNRPQYRLVPGDGGRIERCILRGYPGARFQAARLQIVKAGTEAPSLSLDRPGSSLVMEKVAALGEAAREHGPGEEGSTGARRTRPSQQGEVPGEPEALRKALQAASQGAADTADLYRRLGQSLLEQGAYGEALEVVRRGQQRFPAYTDLHYLEGLIHAASHRYTEAVGAWQRCLALGEVADKYPTTVGVGTFLAYHRLGDAYRQLREFSRAVSCYTQALLSNPGYHQVLEPLLQALHGTGKSAHEALEYLERYFEVASPAARLAVADALCGIGGAALALEMLGDRPAEGMDGEAWRVIRGQCLLRAGRHEEALAVLTTTCHSERWCRRAATLGAVACWLQPVPTSAAAFTARLREAGATAFAIALEAFESVWLAGSSQVPAELLALEEGERLNALLSLMQEWLLLGQRRPATITVDLLGKALPANRFALTLGKLLYSAGYQDEAANWLLKAWEDGSTDEELFVMLADICCGRGLYEEAEKLVLPLLKAGDHPYTLYVTLARTYLRHAHEVLSRGVQALPGSHTLQEERSRVEEALRWL